MYGQSVTLGLFYLVLLAPHGLFHLIRLCAHENETNMSFTTVCIINVSHLFV
jgi:hypothetical protein